MEKVEKNYGEEGKKNLELVCVFVCVYLLKQLYLCLTLEVMLYKFFLSFMKNTFQIRWILGAWYRICLFPEEKHLSVYVTGP